MSESGQSKAERSTPPPQKEAFPSKEPIGGILKSAADMFKLTKVIEREADIDEAENKIGKQINKGGLLSSAVDNRLLVRSIAAGFIALGLGCDNIFNEGKPKEPLLTPGQSQAVEKVTGESFTELSKRFKIEYLVSPDQTGNYIIHIGQSHEDPDSTDSVPDQEYVISNQKRIEGLAQSTIAANNLQCVFSEGVVDENGMLQIRDLIKGTEKMIDIAIKKPINTFEDLSRLYKIFLSSSQFISSPHAFHYLGTKIDSLRGKMAEAIEKGIISQDNNLNDINKIQATINRFPLLGGRSNLYLMGVEFKLLMDGKIEYLCPAEDEILNEQAFNASDKKKIAENGYFKSWIELSRKVLTEDEFNDYINVRNKMNDAIKNGVQNLTEKEWANVKEAMQKFDIYVKKVDTLAADDPQLKILKLRLDQAELEYKRLTHAERDKEILRKIDTYDQKAQLIGKSQGNILVIYGKSHDLTNAVTWWNGQNPERAKDRGLIKFSPKVE